MDKKFISAGAGSGKTYRITNDVADMIKDGHLKPEQVIMTTFTKAAAQELREKAKSELDKRHLNKEAQQMEHALIGTVHSVANTFLTKYWYLLGIMPDAAAMEEDEVQAFRDHSLRGLLSKEDRKNDQKPSPQQHSSAVLNRSCTRRSRRFPGGIVREWGSRRPLFIIRLC